MNTLLKLHKKRTRIIIGLMSGTSHDGVDAAVVKIKGSDFKTVTTLLSHHHLRYPLAIRTEIKRAFQGDTEGICGLNYRLGRLFAKAALTAVRKSGLERSQVDAVASHGQTLCHLPPRKKGATGSTLQIGESAVISELTGLPVISDFRAADMAAGGQGAPLVPYADLLLFGERKKTRLVLNIGGIANLTLVTPNKEDTMAFDTGPGNAMIDDAMLLLFNKPMDRNGVTASLGKPDHGLLDKLMKSTYLKKSPPKSLDRRFFNVSFIRGTAYKEKRPEDIVCTLTHFTVRSIVFALKRFVPTRFEPAELIVTGGGSRNKYMMSLLKMSLPRLVIRRIDEYGVPYRAKEALSFAVLGNETLSGIPSNVPSATGASHPAILGKITLPFNSRRYLHARP